MPEKIALPKDHLFLTVEHKIKEVLNQEFDNLKITYFNYLRVYDDRKSILFATHNKVIEYLFDNCVPVMAHVDNENLCQKFQYHVLPIGAYDKALHDFNSQFNLGHFFNLVQRFNGYYELLCFGSTSNNFNIVNYYINNIWKLENFRSIMINKMKDLFKDLEHNLITFPNVMYPAFMDIKKLTAEKTLTFRNPYKHIKLSKQQLCCIKLLCSGLTIKKIAMEMELSPRTVDHYLEYVKHKFRCHSNTDLITIIFRFSNIQHLI